MSSIKPFRRRHPNSPDSRASDDPAARHAHRSIHHGRRARFWTLGWKRRSLCRTHRVRWRRVWRRVWPLWELRKPLKLVDNKACNLGSFQVECRIISSINEDQAAQVLPVLTEYILLVPAIFVQLLDRTSWVWSTWSPSPSCWPRAGGRRPPRRRRWASGRRKKSGSWRTLPTRGNHQFFREILNLRRNKSIVFFLLFFPLLN